MATAQSIPQVQSATLEQQAATAPRAATITAAVFMGIFGLSLVWASGFANSDVLHAAAHDSRHSLVFPCH